METIYMNQHLAKLENTEIYSKILFFIYKRVLNEFDDYFMTLKCSMAHSKACACKSQTRYTLPILRQSCRTQNTMACHLELSGATAN